MIIYKATNEITGECYIGKTKNDLRSRVIDHEYEAFVRKRNSKFYSALREFGIKVFKWEIVDRAVNFAQLKKIEKKHIIKNDSIDYGYNSQVR